MTQIQHVGRGIIRHSRKLRRWWRAHQQRLISSLLIVTFTFSMTGLHTALAYALDYNQTYSLESTSRDKTLKAPSNPLSENKPDAFLMYSPPEMLDTLGSTPVRDTALNVLKASYGDLLDTVSLKTVAERVSGGMDVETALSMVTGQSAGAQTAAVELSSASQGTPTSLNPDIMAEALTLGQGPMAATLGMQALDSGARVIATDSQGLAALPPAFADRQDAAAPAQTAKNIGAQTEKDEAQEPQTQTAQKTADAGETEKDSTLTGTSQIEQPKTADAAGQPTQGKDDSQSKPEQSAATSLDQRAGAEGADKKSGEQKAGSEKSSPLLKQVVDRLTKEVFAVLGVSQPTKEEGAGELVQTPMLESKTAAATEPKTDKTTEGATPALAVMPADRTEGEATQEASLAKQVLTMLGLAVEKEAAGEKEETASRADTQDAAVHDDSSSAADLNSAPKVQDNRSAQVDVTLLQSAETRALVSQSAPAESVAISPQLQAMADLPQTPENPVVVVNEAQSLPVQNSVEYSVESIGMALTGPALSEQEYSAAASAAPTLSEPQVQTASLDVLLSGTNPNYDPLNPSGTLTHENNTKIQVQSIAEVLAASVRPVEPLQIFAKNGELIPQQHAEKATPYLANITAALQTLQGDQRLDSQAAYTMVANLPAIVSTGMNQVIAGQPLVTTAPATQSHRFSFPASSDADRTIGVAPATTPQNVDVNLTAPTVEIQSGREYVYENDESGVPRGTSAWKHLYQEWGSRHQRMDYTLHESNAANSPNAPIVNDQIAAKTWNDIADTYATAFEHPEVPDEGGGGGGGGGCAGFFASPLGKIFTFVASAVLSWVSFGAAAPLLLKFVIVLLEFINTFVPLSPELSMALSIVTAVAGGWANGVVEGAKSATKEAVTSFIKDAGGLLGTLAEKSVQKAILKAVMKELAVSLFAQMVPEASVFASMAFNLAAGAVAGGIAEMVAGESGSFADGFMKEVKGLLGFGAKETVSLASMDVRQIIFSPLMQTVGTLTLQVAFSGIFGKSDQMGQFISNMLAQGIWGGVCYFADMQDPNAAAVGLGEIELPASGASSALLTSSGPGVMSSKSTGIQGGTLFDQVYAKWGGAIDTTLGSMNTVNISAGSTVSRPASESALSSFLYKGTPEINANDTRSPAIQEQKGPLSKDGVLRTVENTNYWGKSDYAATTPLSNIKLEKIMTYFIKPLASTAARSFMNIYVAPLLQQQGYSSIQTSHFGEVWGQFVDQAIGTYDAGQNSWTTLGDKFTTIVRSDLQTTPTSAASTAGQTNQALASAQPGNANVNGNLPGNSPAGSAANPYTSSANPEAFNTMQGNNAATGFNSGSAQVSNPGDMGVGKNSSATDNRSPASSNQPSSRQSQRQDTSSVNAQSKAAARSADPVTSDSVNGKALEQKDTKLESDRSKTQSTQKEAKAAASLSSSPLRADSKRQSSSTSLNNNLDTTAQTPATNPAANNAAWDQPQAPYLASSQPKESQTPSDSLKSLDRFDSPVLAQFGLKDNNITFGTVVSDPLGRYDDSTMKAPKTTTSQTVADLGAKGVNPNVAPPTAQAAAVAPTAVENRVGFPGTGQAKLIPQSGASALNQPASAGATAQQSPDAIRQAPAVNSVLPGASSAGSVQTQGPQIRQPNASAGVAASTLDRQSSQVQRSEPGQGTTSTQQPAQPGQPVAQPQLAQKPAAGAVNRTSGPAPKKASESAALSRSEASAKANPVAGAAVPKGQVQGASAPTQLKQTSASDRNLSNQADKAKDQQQAMPKNQVQPPTIKDMGLAAGAFSDNKTGERRDGDVPVARPGRDSAAGNGAGNGQANGGNASGQADVNQPINPDQQAQSIANQVQAQSGLADAYLPKAGAQIAFTAFTSREVKSQSLAVQTQVKTLQKEGVLPKSGPFSLSVSQYQNTAGQNVTLVGAKPGSDGSSALYSASVGSGPGAVTTVYKSAVSGGIKTGQAVIYQGNRKTQEVALSNGSTAPVVNPSDLKNQSRVSAPARDKTAPAAAGQPSQALVSGQKITASIPGKSDQPVQVEMTYDPQAPVMDVTAKDGNTYRVGVSPNGQVEKLGTFVTTGGFWSGREQGLQPVGSDKIYLPNGSVFQAVPGGEPKRLTNAYSVKFGDQLYTAQLDVAKVMGLPNEVAGALVLAANATPNNQLAQAAEAVISQWAGSLPPAAVGHRQAQEVLFVAQEKTFSVAPTAGGLARMAASAQASHNPALMLKVAQNQLLNHDPAGAQGLAKQAYHESQNLPASAQAEIKLQAAETLKAAGATNQPIYNEALKAVGGYLDGQLAQGRVSGSDLGLAIRQDALTGGPSKAINSLAGAVARQVENVSSTMKENAQFIPGLGTLTQSADGNTMILTQPSGAVNVTIQFEKKDGSLSAQTMSVANGQGQVQQVFAKGEDGFTLTQEQVPVRMTLAGKTTQENILLPTQAKDATRIKTLLKKEDGKIYQVETNRETHQAMAKEVVAPETGVRALTAANAQQTLMIEGGQVKTLDGRTVAGVKISNPSERQTLAATLVGAGLNPALAQKQVAALGLSDKTVYQVGTTLFIGEPADLAAGHYQSAGVNTFDQAGSEILYVAEYQAGVIQSASLSDGQNILFENGSTQNFTVTQTSADGTRATQAFYKAGQLQGSRVELKAFNTTLTYDGAGQLTPDSLTALRQGGSGFTYQATNDGFILTSTGNGRQEAFTQSGQRVMLAEAGKGGGDQASTEFTLQQTMNLSLAKFNAPTENVTLTQVAKQQVTVQMSENGDLSRITTVSNLAGSQVLKTTENQSTDQATGAVTWTFAQAQTLRTATAQDVTLGIVADQAQDVTLMSYTPGEWLAQGRGVVAESPAGEHVALYKQETSASGQPTLTWMSDQTRIKVTAANLKQFAQAGFKVGDTVTLSAYDQKQPSWTTAGTARIGGDKGVFQWDAKTQAVQWQADQRTVIASAADAKAGFKPGESITLSATRKGQWYLSGNARVGGQVGVYQYSDKAGHLVWKADQKTITWKGQTVTLSATKPGQFYAKIGTKLYKEVGHGKLQLIQPQVTRTVQVARSVRVNGQSNSGYNFAARAAEQLGFKSQEEKFYQIAREELGSQAEASFKTVLQKTTVTRINAEAVAARALTAMPQINLAESRAVLQVNDQGQITTPIEGMTMVRSAVELAMEQMPSALPAEFTAINPPAENRYAQESASTGYFGDQTKNILTAAVDAFFQAGLGTTSVAGPGMVGTTAQLATATVKALFSNLPPDLVDGFFSAFGHEATMKGGVEIAGQGLAAWGEKLTDTPYQDNLAQVQSTVEKIAQGQEVKFSANGLEHTIKAIQVVELTPTRLGPTREAAMIQDAGAFLTVEGNTAKIYVAQNVDLQNAVTHEIVEFIGGLSHEQVSAMENIVSPRPMVERQSTLDSSQEDLIKSAGHSSKTALNAAASFKVVAGRVEPLKTGEKVVVLDSLGAKDLGTIRTQLTANQMDPTRAAEVVGLLSAGEALEAKTAVVVGQNVYVADSLADFQSGDYLSAGQNTFAEGQDTLGYVASFKQGQITTAQLTGNRAMAFKGGSTQDFVMETRSNDGSRIATSEYAGGQLQSTIVQIESVKASLAFDSQGNLTNLQELMSNPSFKAVDGGFMLGKEKYSENGTRLLAGGGSAGGKVLGMEEMTQLTEVNVSFAQYNKEALAVGFTEMTKENAVIQQGADGKVIRMATESNVLGDHLVQTSAVKIQEPVQGQSEWSLLQAKGDKTDLVSRGYAEAGTFAVLEANHGKVVHAPKAIFDDQGQFAVDSQGRLLGTEKTAAGDLTYIAGLNETKTEVVATSIDGKIAAFKAANLAVDEITRVVEHKDATRLEGHGVTYVKEGNAVTVNLGSESGKTTYSLVGTIEMGESDITVIAGMKKDKTAMEPTTAIGEAAVLARAGIAQTEIQHITDRSATQVGKNNVDYIKSDKTVIVSVGKDGSKFIYNLVGTITVGQESITVVAGMNKDKTKLEATTLIGQEAVIKKAGLAEAEIAHVTDRRATEINGHAVKYHKEGSLTVSLGTAEGKTTYSLIGTLTVGEESITIVSGMNKEKTGLEPTTAIGQAEVLVKAGIATQEIAQVGDANAAFVDGHRVDYVNAEQNMTVGMSTTDGTLHYNLIGTIKRGPESLTVVAGMNNDKTQLEATTVIGQKEVLVQAKIAETEIAHLEDAGATEINGRTVHYVKDGDMVTVSLGHEGNQTTHSLIGALATPKGEVLIVAGMDKISQKLEANTAVGSDAALSAAGIADEMIKQVKTDGLAVNGKDVEFGSKGSMTATLSRDGLTGKVSYGLIGTIKMGQEKVTVVAGMGLSENLVDTGAGLLWGSKEKIIQAQTLIGSDLALSALGVLKPSKVTGYALETKIKGEHNQVQTIQFVDKDHNYVVSYDSENGKHQLVGTALLANGEKATVTVAKDGTYNYVETKVLTLADGKKTAIQITPLPQGGTAVTIHGESILLGDDVKAQATSEGIELTDARGVKEVYSPEGIQKTAWSQIARNSWSKFTTEFSQANTNFNASMNHLNQTLSNSELVVQLELEGESPMGGAVAMESGKWIFKVVASGLKNLVGFAGGTISSATAGLIDSAQVAYQATSGMTPAEFSTKSSAGHAVVHQISKAAGDVFKPIDTAMQAGTEFLVGLSKENAAIAGEAFTKAGWSASGIGNFLVGTTATFASVTAGVVGENLPIALLVLVPQATTSVLGFLTKKGVIAKGMELAIGSSVGAMTQAAGTSLLAKDALVNGLDNMFNTFFIEPFVKIGEGLETTVHGTMAAKNAVDRTNAFIAGATMLGGGLIGAKLAHQMTQGPAKLAQEAKGEYVFKPVKDLIQKGLTEALAKGPEAVTAFASQTVGKFLSDGLALKGRQSSQIGEIASKPVGDLLVKDSGLTLSKILEQPKGAERLANLLTDKGFKLSDLKVPEAKGGLQALTSVLRPESVGRNGLRTQAAGNAIAGARFVSGFVKHQADMFKSTVESFARIGQSAEGKASQVKMESEKSGQNQAVQSEKGTLARAADGIKALVDSAKDSVGVLANQAGEVRVGQAEKAPLKPISETESIQSQLKEIKDPQSAESRLLTADLKISQAQDAVSGLQAKQGQALPAGEVLSAKNLRTQIQLAEKQVSAAKLEKAALEFDVKMEGTTDAREVNDLLKQRGEQLQYRGQVTQQIGELKERAHKFEMADTNIRNEQRMLELAQGLATDPSGVKSHEARLKDGIKKLAREMTPQKADRPATVKAVLDILQGKADSLTSVKELFGGDKGLHRLNCMGKNNLGPEAVTIIAELQKVIGGAQTGKLGPAEILASPEAIANRLGITSSEKSSQTASEAGTARRAVDRAIGNLFGLDNLTLENRLLSPAEARTRNAEAKQSLKATMEAFKAKLALPAETAPAENQANAKPLTQAERIAAAIEHALTQRLGESAAGKPELKKAIADTATKMSLEEVGQVAAAADPVAAFEAIAEKYTASERQVTANRKALTEALGETQAKANQALIKQTAQRLTPDELVKIQSAENALGKLQEVASAQRKTQHAETPSFAEVVQQAGAKKITAIERRLNQVQDAQNKHRQAVAELNRASSNRDYQKASNQVYKTALAVDRALRLAQIKPVAGPRWLSVPEMRARYEAWKGTSMWSAAHYLPETLAVRMAMDELAKPLNLAVAIEIKEIMASKEEFISKLQKTNNLERKQAEKLTQDLLEIKENRDASEAVIADLPKFTSEQRQRAIEKAQENGLLEQTALFESKFNEMGLARQELSKLKNYEEILKVKDVTETIDGAWENHYGPLYTEAVKTKYLDRFKKNQEIYQKIIRENLSNLSFEQLQREGGTALFKAFKGLHESMIGKNGFETKADEAQFISEYTSFVVQRITGYKDLRASQKIMITEFMNGNNVGLRAGGGKTLAFIIFPGLVRLMSGETVRGEILVDDPSAIDKYCSAPFGKASESGRPLNHADLAKAFGIELKNGNDLYKKAQETGDFKELTSALNDPTQIVVFDHTTRAHLRNAAVRNLELRNALRQTNLVGIDEVHMPATSQTSAIVGGKVSQPGMMLVQTVERLLNRFSADGFFLGESFKKTLAQFNDQGTVQLGEFTVRREGNLNDPRKTELNKDPNEKIIVITEKNVYLNDAALKALKGFASGDIASTIKTLFSLQGKAGELNSYAVENGLVYPVDQLGKIQYDQISNDLVGQIVAAKKAGLDPFTTVRVNHTTMQTSLSGMYAGNRGARIVGASGTIAGLENLMQSKIGSGSRHISTSLLNVQRYILNTGGRILTQASQADQVVLDSLKRGRNVLVFETSPVEQLRLAGEYLQQIGNTVIGVISASGTGYYIKANEQGTAGADFLTKLQEANTNSEIPLEAKVVPNQMLGGQLCDYVEIKSSGIQKMVEAVGQTKLGKQIVIFNEQAAVGKDFQAELTLVARGAEKLSADMFTQLLLRTGRPGGPDGVWKTERHVLVDLGNVKNTLSAMKSQSRLKEISQIWEANANDRGLTGVLTGLNETQLQTASQDTLGQALKLNAEYRQQELVGDATRFAVQDTFKDRIVIDPLKQALQNDRLSEKVQALVDARLSDVLNQPGGEVDLSLRLENKLAPETLNENYVKETFQGSLSTARGVWGKIRLELIRQPGLLRQGGWDLLKTSFKEISKLNDAAKMIKSGLLPATASKSFADAETLADLFVVGRNLMSGVLSLNSGGARAGLMDVQQNVLIDKVTAGEKLTRADRQEFKKAWEESHNQVSSLKGLSTENIGLAMNQLGVDKETAVVALAGSYRQAVRLMQANLHRAIEAKAQPQSLPATGLESAANGVGQGLTFNQEKQPEVKSGVLSLGQNRVTALMGTLPLIGPVMNRHETRAMEAWRVATAMQVDQADWMAQAEQNQAGLKPQPPTPQARARAIEAMLASEGSRENPVLQAAQAEFGGTPQEFVQAVAARQLATESGQALSQMVDRQIVQQWQSERKAEARDSVSARLAEKYGSDLSFLNKFASTSSPLVEAFLIWRQPAIAKQQYREALGEIADVAEKLPALQQAGWTMTYQNRTMDQAEATDYLAGRLREVTSLAERYGLEMNDTVAGYAAYPLWARSQGQLAQAAQELLDSTSAFHLAVVRPLQRQWEAVQRNQLPLSLFQLRHGILVPVAATVLVSGALAIAATGIAGVSVGTLALGMAAGAAGSLMRPQGAEAGSPGLGKNAQAGSSGILGLLSGPGMKMAMMMVGLLVSPAISAGSIIGTMAGDLSQAAKQSAEMPLVTAVIDPHQVVLNPASDLTRLQSRFEPNLDLSNLGLNPVNPETDRVRAGGAVSARSVDQTQAAPQGLVAAWKREVGDSQNGTVAYTTLSDLLSQFGVRLTVGDEVRTYGYMHMVAALFDLVPAFTAGDNAVVPRSWSRLAAQSTPVQGEGIAYIDIATGNDKPMSGQGIQINRSGTGFLNHRLSEIMMNDALKAAEGLLFTEAELGSLDMAVSQIGRYRNSENKVTEFIKAFITDGEGLRSELAQARKAAEAIGQDPTTLPIIQAYTLVKHKIGEFSESDLAELSLAAAELENEAGPRMTAMVKEIDKASSAEKNNLKAMFETTFGISYKTYEKITQPPLAQRILQLFISREGFVNAQPLAAVQGAARTFIGLGLAAMVAGSALIVLTGGVAVIPGAGLVGLGLLASGEGALLGAQAGQVAFNLNPRQAVAEQIAQATFHPINGEIEKDAALIQQGVQQINTAKAAFDLASPRLPFAQFNPMREMALAVHGGGRSEEQFNQRFGPVWTLASFNEYAGAAPNLVEAAVQIQSADQAVAQARSDFKAKHAMAVETYQQVSISQLVGNPDFQDAVAHLRIKGTRQMISENMRNRAIRVVLNHLLGAMTVLNSAEFAGADQQELKDQLIRSVTEDASQVLGFLQFPVNLRYQESNTRLTVTLTPEAVPRSLTEDKKIMRIIERLQGSGVSILNLDFGPKKSPKIKSTGGAA